MRGNLRKWPCVIMNSDVLKNGLTEDNSTLFCISISHSPYITTLHHALPMKAHSSLDRTEEFRGHTAFTKRPVSTNLNIIRNLNGYQSHASF